MNITNEDTNEVIVDDKVPVGHEGDSDLSCVVCGVALDYSGRGRKPKFCDEHKRSASVNGKTGRSNSGQYAQIETALSANIASLGILLCVVDSTCGTVVIQQSGPIAKSLAEVAKTNPSVRKALIRATTATAWGQVAAAVAPIVLVVAQHHVLSPAPHDNRPPSKPTQPTGETFTVTDDVKDKPPTVPDAELFAA